MIYYVNTDPYLHHDILTLKNKTYSLNAMTEDSFSRDMLAKKVGVWCTSDRNVDMRQ